MQNFNGLKSAIDEKTLILTLKAHGFSAKEISEMTGLAYQSTYQRFSRDSGEFTPTLTKSQAVMVARWFKSDEEYPLAIITSGEVMSKERVEERMLELISTIHTYDSFIRTAQSGDIDELFKKLGELADYAILEGMNIYPFISLYELTCSAHQVEPYSREIPYSLAVFIEENKAQKEEN